MLCFFFTNQCYEKVKLSIDSTRMFRFRITNHRKKSKGSNINHEIFFFVDEFLKLFSKATASFFNEIAFKLVISAYSCECHFLNLINKATTFSRNGD